MVVMIKAPDTENYKNELIISRWKNTRYWAVWLNQELLAVVLYKKGAMAIKKTILAMQQPYMRELSLNTETVSPAQQRRNRAKTVARHPRKRFSYRAHILPTRL